MAKADPPNRRRERIPPDPSGELEAIARMGYSAEDALADIVDNSVDAGARGARIRLYRTNGAVTGVAVADDGSGIDPSILSEIMRFGTRATTGDKGRLGKFGLGLKSASFSQCTELSVASRVPGGSCHGRRWTAEEIAADWWLDWLEEAEAADLIGEFRGAFGRRPVSTVIRWSGMRTTIGSGLESERAVAAFIESLRSHLGLVFHRFLQRPRSSAFSISVDTADAGSRGTGPPIGVEPLNPFLYPHTGQAGYPVEMVCRLSPAEVLRMRAHVLPRNLKRPEYRLVNGAAAHQGFFFYRNDRLLQAGGWNGFVADAEPHRNLARVEVDLPEDLDALFQVNVQKSGVQVPPAFIAGLRAPRSKATPGVPSFAEYVKAAEGAYREKAPGRAANKRVLVPGDGIGAALERRIAVAVLGRGNRDLGEPVTISWKKLPDDLFFSLERGSPGRVILNSTYRSAVLQGAKATGADAPLVKVALFLIARDLLLKQRRSAEDQAAIDAMQRMLVEAAKAQA